MATVNTGSFSQTRSFSVTNSIAGDTAGNLLRPATQANCTTYVAVSTAMVGAIMFGLDQGNFGNVQGFESFLNQWCKGTYDKGDAHACTVDGWKNNSEWKTSFVLWGGSLITIGAALGGLTVGPVLTNKCGRRLCISAGAFICFLGCLLASFLTFGKPFVFMTGRLITGFGVGVCCFALPMYNSEIATPAIRGTMGSMFQLNVVIGSFLATLITLLNQDWRIGMMLPGVAGAIVAFAVWLTPESPRYVMTKRGYDAGVVALRRVRRGDVEDEARAITAQRELEASNEAMSYKQLFTSVNLRKRVLIACYLQIAQQLTGVNAFLSYASTIFSPFVANAFLFNVAWNGIMVAGCILGLLLIDSALGGRRIQLLSATWIMGPPLILAGFTLLLDWPGLIAMIMVCIYGAGFQIAWGTIPWVYPSEIFSMAEKDRALSLAVFWQYAINAAVNICTPLMMDWSTPGTFFVFGALNVTNLVFVATCIKETKGVPLEDVPALFGEGPLATKDLL